MQELARQTFGVGGDAAILVRLMYLAVGTWLLDSVAHALGKGQVVVIINAIAGLVGLYMVLRFIGTVLEAIGRTLGIW